MKWIKRIDRALKRSRFTTEDDGLASYFHTCAVGEHIGGGINKICKYPKIRRKKLRDLAYEFYNEVRGDTPQQALLVYRKIKRIKVLK